MISLYDLRDEFLFFLKEKEWSGNPQSLYDPINYIMELGGKRMRPLALLASYQLYKDDVSDAMDLAYAIEMFHNFTLLHDDIMDEATLRRAKPTVHQKYGRDTAILAGDLMSILSYQSLLLSGSAYMEQILGEFSKLAVQLCEGQQMDMDFENRDDVSISDYIQMITGKTAVLLAGAMKIGAIHGGASEQDAHHLYHFGLNTGILFQIQDDLLDSFGEESRFGKKIGGDIIQGKKTYLYLKTLELLKGEAQNNFKHVYNSASQNEEEKISEVMSYFKEVNVKGYAMELIEVYRQLTLSHLQAISVHEEKKAILRVFMDDLVKRKS